MDELLDVVDANNQPLGLSKSRSQVHRDGDWHRVVHIYVVNQQGEYLAHLRSSEKDLNPSMWDTRFGGHVTAGQTVEDTVISELKQEIGLNVKLIDLIRGKRYNHHGGASNQITQIFYYRFDAPLSALTFNDNEVVEVKWMSVAAILEAMTKAPQSWTSRPDRFREVVEDYEKLQKSLK